MSDESRNLATKLVFGSVPVDLKYLKEDCVLASTGLILVYVFFFHSDSYSHSHPPSLQLRYIHLQTLISCFYYVYLIFRSSKLLV